MGFAGRLLINSAVDIDGAPIQVGLIPEPSGGILLAAGCAALLLRRKKSRG